MARCKIILIAKKLLGLYNYVVHMYHMYIYHIYYPNCVRFLGGLAPVLVAQQ